MLKHKPKKPLAKAPVVVRYVGYSQARTEVGIHLYMPTKSELKNEMVQTEKQGFDTVYVHLSNVYSLVYHGVK